MFRISFETHLCATCVLSRENTHHALHHGVTAVRINFGIRDQAIGVVVDLLLVATELNVLSQAVQKRLEHTHGRVDFQDFAPERRDRFRSVAQVRGGVEAFFVCFVQLLFSHLQRGHHAERLPSWRTPY